MTGMLAVDEEGEEESVVAEDLAAEVIEGVEVVLELVAPSRLRMVAKVVAPSSNVSISRPSPLQKHGTLLSFHLLQ